MVRRKVEWSVGAKNDLFKILDFYFERNGNKNYSIKINKRIQTIITFLKSFPKLGLKCTEDNIRVIIEGDFSIFYEALKNKIIIHCIWDNLQNPQENQFQR